jgi:poly(A) polymerase
MHDAGKVATRTVQKGKVHFFRHEELGALLMQGVAARFALPQALGERVCYIIANHARANVYASDWTDSAVRRLIRDMGPHLDDVLAFSRSDWTTKRAGRIAEVKSLAQELAERIPTIAAEDAKVPPLPKGLGTAIMQETGLGAGPWLGQVQQWLQVECDAGRLAPLQEPAYYLAAVRAGAPELLAIDPQAVRQRTPKPGRVQGN